MDKIDELHPDLQKLITAVNAVMPCKILHGKRGEKEQNALVASGASKLKFPLSSHNADPSDGVDLCPLPIPTNDKEWKNSKRFYFFGGIVLGIAKSLNIAIRWGGDWDRDTDLDDQSFNDLLHFERFKN